MEDPAGNLFEPIDKCFAPAGPAGPGCFLESHHFVRIRVQQLSPLFRAETPMLQDINVDQWIGCHEPHVVLRF
jgi:hypothetical protein